jgi:hypothetical protein
MRWPWTKSLPLPSGSSARPPWPRSAWPWPLRVARRPPRAVRRAACRLRAGPLRQALPRRPRPHHRLPLLPPAGRAVRPAAARAARPGSPQAARPPRSRHRREAPLLRRVVRRRRVGRQDPKPAAPGRPVARRPKVRKGRRHRVPAVSRASPARPHPRACRHPEAARAAVRPQDSRASGAAACRAQACRVREQGRRADRMASQDSPGRQDRVARPMHRVARRRRIRPTRPPVPVAGRKASSPVPARRAVPDRNQAVRALRRVMPPAPVVARAEVPAPRKAAKRAAQAVLPLARPADRAEPVRQVPLEALLPVQQDRMGAEQQHNPDPDRLARAEPVRQRAVLPRLGLAVTVPNVAKAARQAMLLGERVAREASPVRNQVARRVETRARAAAAGLQARRAVQRAAGRAGLAAVR